MTEHELPLSLFYKGWDVYQQRLVEAVAPLTLEELALRSSQQNWSVGMLVMHIVATRVWWFLAHMAWLQFIWDKTIRDAYALIQGKSGCFHPGISTPVSKPRNSCTRSARSFPLLLFK